MAKSTPVTALVCMLAPAPLPPEPDVCTDITGVCVHGHEDGRFYPHTQVTKRRTAGTAQVSLAIAPGRGSMFVDGFYVGSAPFSNLELPGGMHDVQFRDQATLIAWGVLEIPAGSTLTLRVRGR